MYNQHWNTQIIKETNRSKKKIVNKNPWLQHFGFTGPFVCLHILLNHHIDYFVCVLFNLFTYIMKS